MHSSGRSWNISIAMRASVARGSVSRADSVAAFWMVSATRELEAKMDPTHRAISMHQKQRQEAFADHLLRGAPEQELPPRCMAVAAHDQEIGPFLARAR